MSYFQIESWFAIQVVPQHETKVSVLIRYKGYEEFVPTYRRIRRWSDRSKTLVQPLFPGYVFCRFVNNAVGLVRTTPGVIRIVGFSDKPCPISDEEINNLKQVIATRANVLPFAPYIKRNATVQVVNGPLAGVNGTIIRVKSGVRLLLSVDLIGKSVSVEVDASDVEPVRYRNQMTVT